MDTGIIICAGGTPAADYAFRYLKEWGVPVTKDLSPTGRHLLLDCPSFREDGQLRCGGDVCDILRQLSADVTVWGGNLNHPKLSNHKAVDILKDPYYLTENAYITAECALDVTLPRFSGLLRGCPVLIIGWGRIGKCLGRLLRALDADVTVAARKESDRAMLAALGYRAADATSLAELLPRFRLIYNTAPEPVLCREQTALCSPECLKIELASKPGMEGEGILIARGLPGIHRPEASGQLIARTLLRYLNKEESS